MEIRWAPEFIPWDALWASAQEGARERLAQRTRAEDAARTASDILPLTSCMPIWVCFFRGHPPNKYIYIYIYMFPSPVVPSPPPPPQWYGSIQGGGPWPPPPPTGGGGLVGRLAPVCARRCGRVCGAVRVMRCNAICSFCSTRQVSALSQLTVRDATTQFVVCSATTKCQPSALVANALYLLPQRAVWEPWSRGALRSHCATMLPTPHSHRGAGGVGTMDPPTHPTGGRGACRVTLCYLPD